MKLMSPEVYKNNFSIEDERKLVMIPFQMSQLPKYLKNCILRL